MKSRGKIGEACVIKSLQQRGWTILLHNWQDRFVEVDLVAKAPDQSLHLIEVKTSQFLHTSFGSLLERIRPAQLLRLRQALPRLPVFSPTWTSVHIDAAFVHLKGMRRAHVYFYPDCHG